MFGRTRKEISVTAKYHPHIWTVAVDRGQIGQVMMNLFINAWQAMPEGGKLFLETHNVVLKEDDLKPFSIPPGKYVKITVADTGIGMDGSVQKRIFDPFFTTKEMGRGTGLGLASAYGIIKIMAASSMFRVKRGGERHLLFIYRLRHRKSLIPSRLPLRASGRKRDVAPGGR